MDSPVLLERRDQILWVTLNRPDRLNAYTRDLCADLADAVDSYQRDDATRVMVLTGAGNAFCAGGDVASEDEIQEADSRQFGHGMIMREQAHDVVRRLYRLDKPVIAMINGAAVAGGLTFALLTDLRIACASAQLGDSSGRFGLLPDDGGAWLFPRVMGMPAAARMTLLHEVYDAERARELGLVHEVVPDDQLTERVEELAAELAAGAPLALRAAKRMLRRSVDSSLEQSLGDAEMAVNVVNHSEDVREGVAAFLERRRPRFEGR